MELNGLREDKESKLVEDQKKPLEDAKIEKNGKKRKARELEEHQATPSKGSTSKTPPAESTSTSTSAAFPIPLSLDTFLFEPSSLPLSPTSPLPYSILSSAFVLLSSTKSRLLITSILTNLIRTILHFQPHLLLPALYLMMGQGLGAPWEKEGKEYGVGGKMVSDLISELSGCSKSKLRELWNTSGDPGDVAFTALSSSTGGRTTLNFARQEKELTIEFLYETFRELPTIEGKNSMKSKKDKLRKVLLRAKGEEVRWVIRTISNNLRVGAVKLTALNSLARAACLVPFSDADGNEGKDEFYISEERRKGLKVIPEGKREKEAPGREEVMRQLGKAERTIREVYVRHPSYAHIVPALVKHGLSALPSLIRIQPGTPVLFMLGQITRDLKEVEERLGRKRQFVAEWKYDGQRVQMHARRRREGEVPKEGVGGKWTDDGEVYVRLFSRHLEDMTDKYPDIVTLAPHLLSRLPAGEDQSFIIDAEICAIDKETRSLLSFQTLSTRGRKDVKASDVKIRVGIFSFDLMYLNGSSLLQSPFRTRRSLLHTHFPPFESPDPFIARFDHVKNMEGTMEKGEEVESFMREAVEGRCEGIMVKILDEDVGVKEEDDGGEGEESEVEDEQGKKKRGRRKALPASYECDKRADSWLKVKKDYGATGDTFDLVPIGGFHGMGRKNAWYSPILLAVYDAENDTFVAVCKCMSGFSDKVYKEIFERFNPDKDDGMASRQPIFPNVSTPIRPDVYFKPKEVWEIQAADLTLSPVYKAGIGEVSESRGISLRFPRFLNKREDKDVFQAMSAEELGEAYKRQSNVHGRFEEEE
ncbi:ATP-dependent DNA ligase [Atractiella rhizophila]|nr:ATP-dependent DNA ligase [Atractiella rhizophila]